MCRDTELRRFIMLQPELPYNWLNLSNRYDYGCLFPILLILFRHHFGAGFSSAGTSLHAGQDRYRAAELFKV